MDGGKLEEYLAIVKAWLDGHPSDVVTMLWVNADNMPAKDLERFFADTGLKDLAYIPPKHPITPGEWPTLREMIDSGKRLVLYLSGGTDQAAIPWMLDEFSFIFETPFENFDPAQYTCNGDRPGFLRGPEKLQEAAASRIGFQNRFLYDQKLEQFGAQIYTPDPVRQKQINSGDPAVAGNLKDGIEKCASEWGTRGGYLLVDFANEGNPIAVVDAANGFSDPRNRVNAPASFENQPKNLWEPTPSSGEMSKIVDKVFDVGGNILNPDGNIVDTVLDPVEDVVDDAKEKIDEGKEKVKDAKDKIDDLIGGIF